LLLLNTANTTFTNVIIADSLVFSDVQSGELTFYQEFDGVDLPQELMLTNSSLTETVSVAANTIEIDTTILNLITYRIEKTVLHSFNTISPLLLIYIYLFKRNIFFC